MHIQFQRIASGGLALIMAATPGLVSACGGFFSSGDSSVYLNAFRVAFGVTSDHQVTEIVDVSYTGTAANFSWIMPLPATPTVDVAQANTLTLLQGNTDVTVSYPTDYCHKLNITPGGGGYGGGGGGTGSVGPYNYAIIKNDSPDQLVKWLRDNGFTVKSADIPMIVQYVKEGNTFVAMKLKPGANVSDIEPVVFHYQSAKITIPVRLGSIASKGTVPILAWIFADSQYAPTNYVRVDRPDLSTARARNETLRMGSTFDYQPVGFPIYDYEQAVKAIQDKYKGHAFITEMAMKTADLLKAARSEFAYGAGLSKAGPVLAELLKQFPFVTRLTAELAPNQMTIDPLFAPANGLPDIPTVIDLGKRVDPLTMYGCNTHDALDQRLAAEFATNHTTFEAMKFDVGHPADWKLSQFDVMTMENVAGIYVYSPEPVNAYTIDSYFKGRATPPMFIFTPTGYGDARQLVQEMMGYGSSYGSSDRLTLMLPLLNAIDHGTGKDRIVTPNDGYAVDGSFQPIRANGIDAVVLFGILASKAQWQSNQSLFDDMLRYARSHQYYTSASTKDTLFLRVEAKVDSHNSDSPDIFDLPVPNDWTSHMDSNQDILIDSGKGATGPAMRLTLVGSTTANGLGMDEGSRVLAADATNKYYQYPVNTIQRVLSFYGLPGTPADAAITKATQHCALGDTPLKATSFQSGGRTGLILFTNEYVVGVYAPNADFAANQPTLQKMMDAYIAGYQCGIAKEVDGIPPATPGPDATLTPTAVPICPKSPSPRLTVGGSGLVTPGAPDNLRDAPNPNASIVAQVPAGEVFNVLSGPVCDSAAGLTWWKVGTKERVGWIAEGKGTDYFVAPNDTPTS